MTTARELAADFEQPVDDAADFVSVDPGEQAIAALIRGRSRRDVAAERGVNLHTVSTHVAEAVRARNGAAGTWREQLAVVHAGIDDVTARVYAALDSGDYAHDRAALLEVLLSALRFRAGLIAASKPIRGTKEADS